MALSLKHRAFVEEYLATWNATEAYSRVYPKASRETARRNGSVLLTNTDIAGEISLGIAERSMGKDEVLTRLADHAKADIGDFLVMADNGDVSLDIARAEGKTHLIKKVTQRTTRRKSEKSEIEETVLTLELHDAQSALALLGKHHKLFVEQHEVTVTDLLINLDK